MLAHGLGDFDRNPINIIPASVSNLFTVSSFYLYTVLAHRS